MEQLLDTIVANTYTKATARHRLELAREFAEREQYTEADEDSVVKRLETFCAERADAESATALTAWGGEWWRTVLDTDPFETLDELMRKLEKLPEVVLYVARSLPPEQGASIAEKLRELYHPRTLLTLEVREDLLGGCGISVGSSYYDYTLQDRFHRARSKLRTMIADTAPSGSAQ